MSIPLFSLSRIHQTPWSSLQCLHLSSLKHLQNAHQCLVNHHTHSNPSDDCNLPTDYPHSSCCFLSIIRDYHTPPTRPHCCPPTHPIHLTTHYPTPLLPLHLVPHDLDNPFNSLRSSSLSFFCLLYFLYFHSLSLFFPSSLSLIHSSTTVVFFYTVYCITYLSKNTRDPL